MTAEQKSIIKNMRRKMHSYTEIADVTGLSINTIKSYCYRNGLNTDELLKNGTTCKNCGTTIMKQSKTKPRVFCCDDCKLDWWKKHKTEHNSNFIRNYTCPTCGKTFSDYNSAKRVYCSEKCYQRRNSNGQN